MSNMDYTVVSSYTPESVIELVVAHIREGWEPIGGISILLEEIHGRGKRKTYSQAMTREPRPPIVNTGPR